MSVSDPLIKELKAHVLNLIQEAEQNLEITDKSNHFLSFFAVVEKILQKGCIGESWDLFDKLGQDMQTGLLEKSYSYTRAVETVRNSQKVRTPIGKLRLLIRCCLVNKCLQIPIEIMVRSYKDRCWHWFNSKTSILGHDILGEIFLSVILQCSILHFKLDISNARFLDNSLFLPVCIAVEFVPCESLGVAVSFIEDKALVVHVEDNSVAAEDDQIQVGDVLDELNGCVLTAELRGKLSKIMSRSKNKPVAVRIIKADPNKDGHFYPPVLTLLRKANVDFSNVKVRMRANGIDEGNDGLTFNLRGGHVVNYIGNLDIGAEGDVKQIERAISNVVINSKNSKPLSVRLECQELGLKVTEEVSGKSLLSHSFMEISSCGQTRKHLNYFAYIAGDEICNMSKKFTCYVFHSLNENDVQTILQSIGQGFQRTHFAV